MKSSPVQIKVEQLIFLRVEAVVDRSTRSSPTSSRRSSAPVAIRLDPRFAEFTKGFEGLHRPLFAICHGPQLMMAAGIVGKGRTLTAWSTVQGDLRYTGATVKDEPVVQDGNWVTSRKPEDLPKFCQAIVERMKQGSQLPPPQAGDSRLSDSPRPRS